MNKKLIIISIAVVLIILTVFFWQRMSFSKESLKVEILGPETASLG